MASSTASRRSGGRPPLRAVAPAPLDRQAQAVGFTTPSRGVRTRTDRPPAAREFLAALVDVSAPDTTLTDLTAAQLWGLPVPTHAIQTGSSVLSVPAGSAQVRRRDVRGRRVLLPDDHVTVLDGLRVTTPARTWLDCSGTLRLPDLVAMGDVVLRRALAPVEELERMCHCGFRRRGVTLARRAVGLLDGGSESSGESWTRVALVAGGVPRPRCNVDVFADGAWLARVDLLWEVERVVVEYDGRVHLPEVQRRKDALRRNLLRAAGYEVVVFTAADLPHPERGTGRRGSSGRPDPRRP